MNINFLRVVYYFVKRDFKIWTYFKVNFLLELIEIIVDIVTMAIIAFATKDFLRPKLEAYGGDFFNYVVLGLVCNSILSVALTSPSTAIRSAYWNRRIEILLSAPISPPLIVTALSIGPIVRASIRILVYLIVALLIGLTIKSMTLLGLVILVLGFISSIGLGLISSSMFYLLEAKGGGDPVEWVVNIIARLFSGLYYPLNVLPEWCRWLSLLVPHTYVFDAERRILFGATSSIPTLPLHIHFSSIGLTPILTDLIILILYAIVTPPVGYYLLKKGFRIALRDGRLSWWS